jgi:hypothetical protein
VQRSTCTDTFQNSISVTPTALRLGAAAKRLTYRQANQAGLQKAGPALPALARKAEEAQTQIGQILADALDAAQTLRRECCFATRPSDSHQFSSLND